MRTIVAILALSSASVFAQTNAPAQPSSTPALQSTLVQSAGLLAANSAASAAAAATTTTRRVSTGVTPLKLVHSVELGQTRSYSAHGFNGDRSVVIEMIVDETGKPENLKLTKVADPITNAEVLEAVSQFRYEPAKVSGVPTAVPVTLKYNITHNQ
ncbi:TonB family protein [Granulicella tundricola]|uniref:TonB family protein n=1 Tax=Granulicella tundricola (strain ATCC BAA-1859 / DSM 23138 / MP5ACTX9) TaxID=1198114 RepID=E8WX87_GRATM|nr:TonB family protein [Granulicella tundricola]ADW69729.1 TonB family protein [Granulicella tundricola MP5ACTX9]